MGLAGDFDAHAIISPGEDCLRPDRGSSKDKACGAYNNDFG
jgi:hypothetical protein